MQVFRNNFKKSKLNSRRNYDQIKFRENLGPECCVLHSAVGDKNIHQGVQNYTVACCINGCQTWSATMREENPPTVFDSRLRRICGAYREEITRDLKVHVEQLCD